MTTAPIHCARCGKPAPVTVGELTGPALDDDTPNDLGLPVVLIAPDGWIDDPEGEGIICGDPCATPAELRKWMADVAEAEYLIEHGDDGEANGSDDIYIA